MDLDTQSPRQDSNPAVLPARSADDKKEVAWAAIGLVLWSGVILIGLFGGVYILGHTILHMW
jgi:hypothetical protein